MERLDIILSIFQYLFNLFLIVKVIKRQYLSHLMVKVSKSFENEHSLIGIETNSYWSQLKDRLINKCKASYAKVKVQ